MILIIDGHQYHYEMESLCDIFLPFEKVTVVYGDKTDFQDTPGEIVAHTGYTERDGNAHLTASLNWKGKESETQGDCPLDTPDFERRCGLELALLLYRLFVQACSYEPKWGVLIGVRPIKLLRRLTEEMGEPQAIDYFRHDLLVSEEKTALSVRTMRHEQQILSLSRPDSFSLYVSIPFCPTRCAYCSFVAQTLNQTARLVPRYVELLCEELSYTAQVAKDLGLRLESVYLGGGTPTTLSAGQMAQLLDTITTEFDLSTCREFTVEAGRPDTITPEKLEVIKGRGADRISINPQTLNDEVLKVIGRDHTTAQTFDAFELARAHGFTHINMDVIAGLPQDTFESFSSTMDRLIQLSPESITVHTLSLKRSSRLNQNGQTQFFQDADLAGRMLDDSQRALSGAGYLPYYLYRQSRMVGNLENTGWSKPGYESFYNVFIMDETHTIFACGAGAVSKIRDPYSNQLERIFNFKYPHEYESRFPEMLERKKKAKQIFARYLEKNRPV